jgi:hypothetical protein
LKAVSLAAVAEYPAHQVENVDQVGLAKQLQTARVRGRAQPVLAENLAAHLDDGRFLLRDSSDPVPVTDDVDDCRIEADGNRFHFMQRPLVRLVMLAGGRQDCQFRELTPDGGCPPDAHTRRVKPYRGGSFHAASRSAADRLVVRLSASLVQGVSLDQWKPVSGGYTSPGRVPSTLPPVAACSGEALAGMTDSAVHASTIARLTRPRTGLSTTSASFRYHVGLRGPLPNRSPGYSWD